MHKIDQHSVLLHLKERKKNKDSNFVFVYLIETENTCDNIIKLKRFRSCFPNSSFSLKPVHLACALLRLDDDANLNHTLYLQGFSL